MKNHPTQTRNERKKPFLTAASALVPAVMLFISAVAALRAQSGAGQSLSTGQTSNARQPTPQWQIDAGGKMAFDVASVKPDTTTPSQQTVHTNVPLDPMDAFNPTGGLFSATNVRLGAFMQFAYKLSSAQASSLLSSLPKWANTIRFDIEAHGPAGLNPTKDQFRLMMQSLLADRFKLAVHFEIKEMPVMALVLDKPGKLGPHLQSHVADEPCSMGFTDGAGKPSTVAGGFPEPCGTLAGWLESGLLHIGGRNLGFQAAADLFTGPVTGIDRPVLDRTGLKGEYDFVMEFTPPVNGGPGGVVQFDQSGPPFQAALKEQLGLKLVPQTGPVEVLVVDHIEEPSPN